MTDTTSETIDQATPDQAAEFIARFNGTILEQPIAGANKAFLAGIGLAEQVRTDFESKFNELAEDGEKARDRARESAETWREQAKGNARTARENVTRRLGGVVEQVLGYSPIATASDVEKLNAKLDKVLASIK